MNNKAGRCLSLLLVLAVSPCLAAEKDNVRIREWPVLRGPYLGQKPPETTPQIFAPGIITTVDKNELNSVFSPEGNEFYYAVYTPKPVDKCTIMVSLRVKGFWSRPRPVSFSGAGIDVDMAFSSDGKRMYFCSVRGDSKHDIWFSSRQQDRSWSEPVKLGPLINTAQVEAYPTLTRGGRLYFSAFRPEGLGGKDIYYADQANGKFSKPVNPGPPLNSPHSEGDVFVDPGENFLIVSISGRPDSVGQADLYISRRRKDGTWTAPVNLGKPVNSSATEYCPMLTPDGKYFFFSRYQDEKSDVFWVSAEILSH